MTTKTIFITGATAGFGEAIARLFAQHQWQLILVGRRQERLSALEKELSSQTKVHTIAVDVSDEKALQQAIAGLPNAFREIDVLVNNAGLALGLAPAYESNLADWDTMVATNINGVLNCTHTILPSMVARNKGHIINMGSVAGIMPYSGGNVYGATKAFVAQFTKNLCCDLVKTAIRVTNIEPGAAETEFSIVRYKGDEEKAKATYQGMHPLYADDIANTVYWVVNQPPHVTILNIDIIPTNQSLGGFTLHRE
jgi:NADP-dependent 3-hydroxy acid dehydrogenase YdfG